jgi:hypothetical protein
VWALGAVSENRKMESRRLKMVETVKTLDFETFWV